MTDYKQTPAVAQIIAEYWPCGNLEAEKAPKLRSAEAQAIFLRSMRQMQAALIRHHAPKMGEADLARAHKTLAMLEWQGL